MVFKGLRDEDFEPLTAEQQQVVEKLAREEEQRTGMNIYSLRNNIAYRLMAALLMPDVSLEECATRIRADLARDYSPNGNVVQNFAVAGEVHARRKGHPKRGNRR